MIEKLYISADIEGVCGIADWAETRITEGQGAPFRAEMTEEVAAACEAANRAGVQAVFVKDAHGSGRSIEAARLPENVRLMRAWTRDPWSMMAGLDRSFGGAVYIGYHSAGGTDGSPLAHTMDDTNVEVRVNGAIASEFQINAWLAASLGVPSLVVSGDRLLCEHAEALAPGIRAVAVHEGLGAATVQIHPALARRRIAEAVTAALADPPPLPALPPSFEIEVTYRYHAMARKASFYPGARRLGALGAAFSASDWFEATRFLFFVL